MSINCLIYWSCSSLNHVPFLHNPFEEKGGKISFLYEIRTKRSTGLVSRYGQDVPRLTIMVGEHYNRCGSEAVVCEIRFYACSLLHLFHHVAERSYAKTCAAKQDYVVFGIELLALTISWSLKQSI